MHKHVAHTGVRAGKSANGATNVKYALVGASWGDWFAHNDRKTRERALGGALVRR